MIDPGARFAYVVECEFADSAVRAEWVRWLDTEHLEEVLAAGALSAQVVVCDGEPFKAQARYLFADRAAFERYLADHAPRLRAAGLERFPPERGLRYARMTGTVAVRRGE